MPEQHSRRPAADALDELEDAAAAYRRARDAVEEHGRSDLEDVADALQRVRGLLAQYREDATDTGAQEFVQFAQFQGSFGSLVEGLADDLPGRAAFEEARETVDRSRLDESDFERARAALEPAAELAERVDELEDARDRLLAARDGATRRRTELREAAASRERLLELGDADLDAPIEALRDPVERWNDAATDAIGELRSEAPARELFDLLERAERYPLVDLPAPSAELATYVRERPVGEESLTRLLEYADFSRSKLEHYVDDPARFRRTVATERSLLESVSAEPLSIAWPPPPAEALPWRVRAIRHVVASRVEADAVAALRRVETLARDRERYERLRTAAEADAELDDEDRRRLASGDVEAELSTYREAIERVDEALASVPDP